MLPATMGEPAYSAPPRAEGFQTMKHVLRVFVVDDRPAIAYTLSAVLRDYGYSVTPYTNTLSALRDSPKLAPDVLISDVDMPELDGVDLAMQVQARCPN